MGGMVLGRMLGILVVLGSLHSPCFAEPPQEKQQKQKPQPRTDRYGDSLPAGALARLGTVRLRPQEILSLLTCLPDNKTILAVGSDDDHTSIRLWDMTTGRLLRRFEPPFRIRDALGHAAISADGKSVLVGGYSFEDTSFRVSLLDVPSGKQTKERIGIDPWITAFAFAPDGKSFATASQHQPIRLWGRAADAPLRSFGKADVEWKQLAFSPDGKILGSAGAECKVQLWDVATGRELRSLGGHSSQTTAVVFSPDGKTLASLDYADPQEKDGLLQLWNTETGEKSQKWTTAEIQRIVFSADGRFLAGVIGNDFLRKGGRERTFHIWDSATGEHRSIVVPQRARVFSLTFSPDGRLLASCEWERGFPANGCASTRWQRVRKSVPGKPATVSCKALLSRRTANAWLPPMTAPGQQFDRPFAFGTWTAAKNC